MISPTLTPITSIGKTSVKRTLYGMKSGPHFPKVRQMNTAPDNIQLPCCNQDMFFLDLETTGLDIEMDKIVQIGLIRLPARAKGCAFQEYESYNITLNPEMKIPTSALKIHGISNDMVKDKPIFKDIAQEIYDLLKKQFVCGYNIMQFDLPILYRELENAGITDLLPLEGIIDLWRFFKFSKCKSSKNLTNAYTYYTGKIPDREIHDAVKDAEMCLHMIRNILKDIKIPEDLLLDLDMLDKHFWDNFGNEQISNLPPILPFLTWVTTVLPNYKMKKVLKFTK
jgi:DNA polymerase III epsilon subunit-like protein